MIRWCINTYKKFVHMGTYGTYLQILNYKYLKFNLNLKATVPHEDSKMMNIDIYAIYAFIKINK